jgi:hypothetical protein
MKDQERKNERGHHENPLPGEISRDDKRKAMTARVKAEKDIDDDPEFSAKSPNDDLDEGEAARLGEETDIV